MRVISWNMAYWTRGHFKEIPNRQRQWALLMASAPDVALLQECRPEDLVNFAPAWAGDEYEVIGAIPAGFTACSAILARRSLAPSPVDPASFPDPEERWIRSLNGYLVPATVTLNGLPIVVTSVHTSAREITDAAITQADHDAVKRKLLDKAWNNDLAVGALKPLVNGCHFVVGGDWNVARLFDKTYPHLPSAGIEFFDRAETWGWCESLRKFHPEELRTWLNAEHHPYELDHLFTDPELHAKLYRCDVIDDALVRELSDHAPVIAEFDLALSEHADGRAEPRKG
jgi:exonuclease III